MSRRIADLRRRQESSEEGFSLIEVLVAIVLFGLLSTAVVPLLITAARASSITKYDTGARNIGQERLERMRTAPFHTPQAALAGPDLLDTYFPNMTAAASVNANGYVSATAPRKENEPAGPFYRYNVPAAQIAPDAATAETFSRYTQRVATQFLNAQGSPFAPTSWNALLSPNDEAVPSFIVRATVITTWTVGPLSKSYALSSNLTEGRADSPLAQGEVRATAVRLLSSIPDAATAQGADLLFEGGVVTADGQITRGAKVSTSSLGAFASLVPGTRVDGANGGSSSPANATSIASGVGPKVLSLGADELVRFGSTDTGTSATSADNGQIAAGTTTSPVSAKVSTNSDIRFGNLPSQASGRLGLLTGMPVVRNLTTTGMSTAASTAVLTSTGGSTHTVSGRVTSASPLLAVLPTSYAPDGLLQVRLDASTLTCAAGVGVTPTSLTYSATVRFWMRAANGQEGYATTSLSLSHSSTTDPLIALIGSATSAALPVHQNPDGTVLTYADYFNGMASSTVSSLAAERIASAGGIESRHGGLVQLSTVSLRDDLDSPVTLQLGVLSCLAKDVR